jgi:hypothetical protein
MTRPPPLLGEHNREILGEPPSDAQALPKSCDSSGGRI